MGCYIGLIRAIFLGICFRHCQVHVNFVNERNMISQCKACQLRGYFEGWSQAYHLLVVHLMVPLPWGGLLGGTWVNFCRVYATGLSEPLPHYSLFCGQLQTPSQPLLGRYVICTIPTESLSIFMIDPFFRFNEEHFTFHPQYKHSGTFANRKYEELSYPKKSKNVRPYSSNSIEICNPIMVNPVVKM